MARLYADENFPQPVVEALRSLGHDVLTAFDAGQAGQRIPDDQVLEFATIERRAVLSLNRRDFIHLHQRNDRHGGLILCTFDPDFTAQAQRISEAILAQGDLGDRLVRVNRPPR